MRKIAALVVIAACSGSEAGSDAVVPTPDECVDADRCEASTDLVNEICGLHYMCDPTYQKTTLECFDEEWNRLCSAGDAARACALTPYQRDYEFKPCLGMQNTCGTGDPVSCIP